MMAMDDNSTDGRDRDLHFERSYLKAFDVDGSVDRFQVLPVLGMRLVTASAAFTRLQSVFELTRYANWDDYDMDQWDRAYDAVGDYEILREALLTALEGEPAFRLAYQLAHRAFPMPYSAFHSAFVFVTTKDPMPDLSSAKATEMMSWWTLDLKSETLELEDELKRLGAQVGVDPFARDINAFLLAEDELPEDMIGPIPGNVFDAVRDAWQRMRAALTASERSSPVAKANVDSSAKRSGRRPVDVTYEVAARSWWEMVDDYEVRRERRAPNQADLCDALKAQGYSIKPRTLRNRIKQWREGGSNGLPRVSCSQGLIPAVLAVSAAPLLSILISWTPAYGVACK